MDIAHSVAAMSSAQRLQVGAIVVKDDRVISMGYNGMPSGWTNECEDVIQHSDDTTTLKTKPEVLHAETNAIAKLARSGESGLDSDLFVTHSPCLDCAKIIYQSGIRRVYFGCAYRDNSGMDFLGKSGVEVIKIDS